MQVSELRDDPGFKAFDRKGREDCAKDAEKNLETQRIAENGHGERRDKNRRHKGMTEMPSGNSGVEFGVYVVETISGDVDRFASQKVMENFLDETAVRRNGYEAYDRAGYVLRLEATEEQSSRLKLSRTENQLMVSDFWELKFSAVAHEEMVTSSLFAPLRRWFGLAKS